jgi:hypothetical protein
MPYKIVNGRLVSVGSKALSGLSQLANELYQRSFLKSVGSVGLSGLGMVGNLLDVPGSMVRDILGLVTTGKLHKYNPFDQLW